MKERTKLNVMKQLLQNYSEQKDFALSDGKNDDRV